MNPGDILNARYRLIALIGKGGMGSVWQAHHLELDAPIAIKLMNCDDRDDPQARVRFSREARSAANIRSRHVVETLDFGIDDATGTPYIVMELLRGQALSAHIQNRGQLSPRDTLRIVTQICRALSQAHQMGIVHRDLKPDNIHLLDEDGEEVAKILDFGIAKWTSNETGRRGPTTTGGFIGTPHYMSPEQMQSAKHVDYRTDLWSLGIIACECLTGRLPFEAPNLPALILRIAAGRATPPSELGSVPGGFDAWFAKATHVDPEHRFQSASELAHALKACLQGALSDTERISVEGLTIVGSTPAATRAAQPDGEGIPVSRTSSRVGLREVRGRLALAVGLVMGGLALWRSPLTEERPGNDASAATPTPSARHSLALRPSAVPSSSQAADGGARPLAPGDPPERRSKRDAGAVAGRARDEDGIPMTAEGASPKARAAESHRDEGRARRAIAPPKAVRRVENQQPQTEQSAGSSPLTTPDPRAEPSATERPADPWDLY